MADTWRDQLLPASFRGETFLIEDTSVPVGRKVQLHEYPKRDQAFAEQMGKVARVHKVRAFIIGDDCFARRDKLLTALEKEGEGTLVHPWLGQLSVVPGACEMSHSRREGGMVSFDLTFYPGNAVQNPAVKANTAKMLGQTSASYWSGALDRYNSAMAKVDTARINLIGLQNQVTGVFGILSGQFSPLAGVIGSVTSMAQMLINAPGSLSGLFTGYFSDLGLSSLVPKGSEKKSSASAAAFDSYTTAVATVSSQAEDASTINEVAGGSGGDTTAAAQALSDLVQDAVLVQAAATVAEMPVVAPPEADAPAASLEQQLVNPTERPEVPVADDVIAARDELDEVFWQAALKSDASYYPLVNATRQHVVRHLTAVAASGVRLETVTPLETSPALVLAFRRFGDATREGEVVQRNKITHPGFVPAAPLQIARE
ncbi:DNA circularization protein [Pseudomonas graminis]|uniref:Mu-like prophage DNA circulation protein n=1 Tax=Pseudomonas graminis TaxID=158627 RepID=A0A1I0GZM9_9PSED|nr:DNA circularization N-terminal domain-containing protein [Pseudomonas graminis]SET76886.1 Mu-like prophage DNA circulation protein [Pseudomonas graminis]